jgi:hypothetical protein
MFSDRPCRVERREQGDALIEDGRIRFALMNALVLSNVRIVGNTELSIHKTSGLPVNRSELVDE